MKYGTTKLINYDTYQTHTNDNQETKIYFVLRWNKTQCIHHASTHEFSPADLYVPNYLPNSKEEQTFSYKSQVNYSTQGKLEIRHINIRLFKWIIFHFELIKIMCNFLFVIKLINSYFPFHLGWKYITAVKKF